MIGCANPAQVVMSELVAASKAIGWTWRSTSGGDLSNLLLRTRDAAHGRLTRYRWCCVVSYMMTPFGGHVVRSACLIAKQMLFGKDK